jgi:hypothetical protein
MKPCKIGQRKSIIHPKEKREEQPKRERERERTNIQQGMCHTMAFAIYIKKYYLKAKEEELWKFKYFTMQKYNLQKIKILYKKPKSFKIYYNSIITNPKLQHKPKYHHHLSKILL